MPDSYCISDTLLKRMAFCDEMMSVARWLRHEWGKKECPDCGKRDCVAFLEHKSIVLMCTVSNRPAPTPKYI